ncbi:MAG: PIN domain-containing protein [Acidobacteria bacterium]|nr:MAG: PIN domain-containing protein [Acidobacteriota bacterium]
MTAVIDASLALAWYFPDESSALAEAVLRHLEGAALFVPALWASEIANGIVVGIRRRRVTSASKDQFLVLLAQLPIQIEPELFPEHVQQVVALAEAYQLTAYDAAYLELALRRSARLATLDRELRRAARRAGVSLLPERLD